MKPVVKHKRYMKLTAMVALSYYLGGYCLFCVVLGLESILFEAKQIR